MEEKQMEFELYSELSEEELEIEGKLFEDELYEEENKYNSQDICDLKNLNLELRRIESKYTNKNLKKLEIIDVKYLYCKSIYEFAELYYNELEIKYSTFETTEYRELFWEKAKKLFSEYKEV
jgi:hypothetical protein